MIRLQSTNNDKRYDGAFKYRILYDYSAGHKDRYLVLVLNVDDPIIIGRELDLKTVLELIEEYEKAAKDIFWFTGDRADIIAVKTHVLSIRKIV